MRLAIIATIHGRPRLTALFLRHYEHLAESLPLDLYAVGTPETVSSDRWQYRQVPNDNLAARWNAVCSDAYVNGAEAVFVVGSDDFVSHQAILFTLQALRVFPVVVPRSCYVYDLARRRLVYLTRLICVGLGRAFRRDVLERYEGRLWAEAFPWMPVAAQQAVVEELDQAHVYDPREERCLLVDVKTAEGNLNSFDALLRRTAYDEAPMALMRLLGPTYDELNNHAADAPGVL